MNGVINVLKPTGMTSHDVVYQIRKKFDIQKVGHTGTLDPNVAGVLPITVGKATKLTQILTDKDKSYRCMMTFGKQTTTSDTYGDIVNITSVDIKYSYEKIKDVFDKFIGYIVQTPSIYSAIKVNGQKLYQIARKGKTVDEIPKRTVQIHSIDLISIIKNSVIFDITCSKGTYIRTLVEDIASELNDIAYMNFLIRTKSGQFDIQDSVAIDDISEDDIIKVKDIVIDGCEDIILNDNQIYRYINGLKMTSEYIKNFKYSSKNLYKIYDKNDNLISIASLKNEQLKNIAMFN